MSSKSILGKLRGLKQSLEEERLLLFSYVILSGLLIYLCTVPGFLTTANLYILLQRVAFLGLLSVGMTLVILTGGIDLSVGSVVALAAVLTGYFQHWGTCLSFRGAGSFIAPEPVILLMILGIGAAVGLLNGFSSGIGIPDFAVTLATLFSIRGAAFAVTGGLIVYGIGPLTRRVATGDIGHVPYVFLIFVGILICMHILLKNTPLGKSIYAIGENARVATLSGISYLKTKLAVYTISGILAAMGGWIMAGRTDVGNPMFGIGAELDAIAAVVIGGTNLYGGAGGLVHTIAGVLIISLARNLLELHGVPATLRFVLIALILGASLVLQRVLSRK